MKILDEARDAFHSGKYPEALEKYDYFFEHALNDDPHSLYGVRLSYCLDEWAQLGEKYPEALTRLENKRDHTLAQIVKTKAPERFHDYIAICKYLGSPSLPIKPFLRFHAEDRDLSKIIVRFIWDKLVKEGLWEICISYLPDPKESYKHSVYKFDETMKVCKSDPGLGGEDFEQQIKGWYVRDVSNILLVLKSNGKTDEFVLIREHSRSDLQSRGYPELAVKIEDKLTL